MGQWFKLVNLDKRKTMELCKLCESLYDTFIHFFLAGYSYRLLTSDEYLDKGRERLKRKAKYYTPGVRRYYRGVHDQAQSSLLRKLPTEIIAMCVAAADTVRDKACFALSCMAVWDIARPDLVKALHAEMNWEGDRIMVLGEYVTVDDMPPNVLNHEERAIVRAVLEDPKEDDPPYVSELLDALGTSKTGSPKWTLHEWLNANRPRGAAERWDMHEEDYFIWIELVEEEQRAVESRGAVLRNLTTHEYVRGDARRKARQAAGRPYDRTPLYSWPFGDILLMRICWSPTSDSEVLEGHNPRNVWAGHRFDFAREDALPRDAEGKVLPPWKDVSEDYMKELSEWSSQYDIVDRY